MIEIRHTEDEGLRRAYDDLYARRSTRHEEDYYRWLLRLLRPLPGEWFLDAACGEGDLARLAAGEGLRACGVDFSRRALAQARREEGKAPFLAVGDGERLPFADGAFHCLASVGSLEHYPDPAAGAREMVRVLAPGGRALVLLPNTFGLLWTIRHARRTGEIFDDGQPIQRYGTRAEWTALLEGQGFTVERVVGYDEPPRPSGPAGWLRRLCRPWGFFVSLCIWNLVPVNLASCLIFVCTRGKDR